MFFNDLVKRGLEPELQEPTLAPAGWLKGLDKVYSRFCITAGDEECPIDQTNETREFLSRYVSDTELVIELCARGGDPGLGRLGCDHRVLVQVTGGRK